MNESRPTVAWILPTVWHYHAARIAAVIAGNRLGVQVIELARRGEFAALSSPLGPDTRLMVQTLVPDGATGRPPPHDLCRRMDAALESLAPDAVMVPGWSMPWALASLAWCRRRAIPSIVCSDSQAIDAPRIWWREAIKQRIVVQFDAALAAGSRHVDYLAALGMERSRIMTAYDVVDNAHFAAGADAARAAREEVRCRLALPDRFFLACNRFVAKKNLAGLLQAYARYRQAQGAQARHLVLLGDGPLRELLAALVRRLSLSDFVHMPGFIGYTELPGYYGLADAFLHASTVDQWGLVVNEAMAAGLPVLVSRACGCAPDLVEEGRNGFTFDPANLGQLASLMTRITLPESDSHGMGQASRAIIARWTPSDFARNLAGAFEIACRARAKPWNIPDRFVVNMMMRLNLR